MGNEFLYRLIRSAIILGIFSVVFGCASNSAEQETFMGEGFQSSLPNPGTRVVVWGNHSGAVTRTLGWLQDHQILGVDPSWIEKELTDPGFFQRTRMEKKAQVLAAAKSVGATIVVFAQVEDSQLGRKFDLMSFGNKRMKIIGVEIRGMNAETGDVVFGAKAWNSEPMVESEQIVLDLTTFALQKAWNQSDGALPLQQEVPQHKPQQEQVKVVTSYSDEIPPVPAPSKSESDRPLSLQQEVAQPKSQQEEVSVASSYSVEMPPTLETPKSESDRALPLQQEVPQHKPQREQVTVLTSAEMLSEPVPYKSETIEPQSFEEEPSLGLQIAGGALSVLYTPLKVGYAGLGGFMGGLAYLLTAGNEQVSQSIWDASLNGTYWLTARHLQGEEAIHFMGEPSQIDPVRQARLDEAMLMGAVAE
jgi:hypothetical protein